MIVLAIGSMTWTAGARLVVCDVPLDELLPRLAGLRVERVSTCPKTVRITAFTREDARRACPGCGQESDWVHSRYVRHVADESVGGRPVVIDLSVRRLYCENADCPRTTFVEQVDGALPAQGAGAAADRRGGRGGPGGLGRCSTARGAAPDAVPGVGAELSDAHAAARPAHGRGGRAGSTNSPCSRATAMPRSSRTQTVASVSTCCLTAWR
ncbi:transposase family protein [Streptomyces sp. 8P21H-1]|nr:transposase family protein [Streptomyces sp. 8P21H-1]